MENFNTKREIWIAEIKSRFSESSEIRNQNEELIGEEFVNSLKAFGLFHKLTDNSNKMFTRFEFLNHHQIFYVNVN